MTEDGSPGRVRPGEWVSPENGEARNDVLADLGTRAVVLLGESHDNADHHRWQLQTVTGLYGRRPEMILGFEMFPRRVQPILDRWCASELTEPAFLREVDWPTIWGFSAELYLPLFNFARIHGVPMLALNIDRATSRRVAAHQDRALSPDDREGVGEPAPALPRYRDRLFTWFRNHPSAGAKPRADSEGFERFVRAQQLWDRAMAEAIASVRRVSRPPLVIGIMGAGHIEYGDGVPHQLAALGVRDIATALPWDASIEYPAGSPPVADLLSGYRR